MKSKKSKFFFVIFTIFLVFSCNHKFGKESKKNNTILEKTNSYFDSINWTESESILAEPMAEPFSLKKITNEEIALYSDTNTSESLFPEIEGLGILDYSGIEASLLTFLSKIGTQIKAKQIDKELCLKEKEFLPFLIDYRLKRLEDISSIYFARPEYKANKKASAKFRCNIRQENSNKAQAYILLELTVIYSGDKWLIDSFDVLGAKNAKPIKQD